jgi:hypothetical protein
MKTQVKPTKKNSPAIHRGANRDNGTADEYAKPHTMTGKPVHGDAGVEYMTDPNSMMAIESTPGGMPARRVSMGNPARNDVKESGIKIRGTGAAIKGVMARGPMA